MSCTRESLLMNVTLCPTLMVTWEGLTAPLVPIVIVAPLGPGAPLLPEGAVGELLPPHAVIMASVPAATVDPESIRIRRVKKSSELKRGKARVFRKTFARC
jgi:hypothetical protein